MPEASKCTVQTTTPFFSFFACPFRPTTTLLSRRPSFSILVIPMAPPTRLPVRACKQTPFQDAPLDLDFCPLFYLNRRTAVDARLAELRAASAAELVALVGDAWLANAGTVCRGLNWDRSSVRHLQVLLVCGIFRSRGRAWRSVLRSAAGACSGRSCCLRRRGFLFGYPLSLPPLSRKAPHAVCRRGFRCLFPPP